MYSEREDARINIAGMVHIIKEAIMNKYKCNGTEFGVVLGFFGALLFENTLLILLGIAIGSLYDKRGKLI